jgi:hypothetical protein
MHPVLRWLPAVASLVTAGFAAAPLRRALAEDACLDRGGRVMHETAQCLFGADHAVTLASFPGPASGARLVLGALVGSSCALTVLLVRRGRRDERGASA